MTSRRAFLRTLSVGLAGMALSGSSLLAQTSGARTHKVVRGDTLGGIATRHGITITALKIANGLKSDRILIGQVLTIPGTGAGMAELKEVIDATKSLRITRGRWRYVVVHHSGIEAGNARAYGSAHKRRGMENGLAYDFVIGNGKDSGDGEIEIGPRWLKQLDGGHVRSPFYNAHGIGICLVGNFEKRRPGARQMASLTALVDWLRDEAPLGAKPKFTVHRWVDKNHTLCPGRYFPYLAMKKRYA